MHQLIARLASLRITVTVLLALIVALAAGTIVESRAGTAAAQHTVYAAPWFLALLGAFALNTLAAVLHRFPTSRWRIGFLLTHGGMLVILLGGFLTADLAVRGQLPLWEGQQAASFLESQEAGTLTRALPFTLRLDGFEIDTYQGTQRPAMFRSRVTVTDPALGSSFPAVIEMNRPLTHRGYSFFQSSYEITAQGERSVLAVSHDPGQPVVFAGYGLLVLGMIVVLVTRIAQQRVRPDAVPSAYAEAPIPAPAPASRRELPVPPAAAARAGGGKGNGKRRRKVAAALLAALLGAGAASAAELADAATTARLRALPVQNDGRLMPFDTLARQAVFEVTGSRRPWRGADPAALVLGWALYPAQWAREPLVAVDSPSIARIAGLGPEESHASFFRLVGDPGVRQALESAHAARTEGRQPTPEEQEALDLSDRLLWLQSVLGREALRAAPAATPGAAWSGPPATTSEPAALVAWLDAQLARGAAPATEMQRELRYNDLRPTRLAWWALLPATLAAAAAWLRPRRSLQLAAVAGLLLGSAAMTWGIAVRWAIAGRIPATDMYESLLFLGAGAGLFGLLAAAVLRNRLVVFNATAMAALTMALVDLLPMDPFIHPPPPVLSGTPWLAIHVPIIMVSYAVLGLAVVLAHMQIGIEILAPARRAAAARMSELHYWYLHVGCILLITGILTGSIWGASSWGRYWGWDPKEVWSLVAFLAYMAILHARFDRMIGSFAVAAASIVAFLTILMTYLGVNYVLAAGLHSYGFGGGAVAKWLAAVAVAEATFLGIGYVSWRGRARQEEAAALPVPA
jgi:ABC-type transport system involved in cytochrome c biogenesis permease subunit